LAKKKISQAFFDLVRADRDCYYAALSATIPLKKFYNTNPERLNEFSLGMKEFWGNIFIEAPITQSKLMRSSFWFDYIKSYLSYKEFTQTDFSIQKIRGFYEKGLIHTYNIQEAKKYISGDMLEYYQAAYIYFESSKKEYEKELLALFEDFKKNWPNSQLIKYLEPKINPIREYHKAIEQPFSEKINFINRCETFNSLKESLAQFKGKKVFIDVWATWCGPCKEEFKYRTKLQELMKLKGFEILYISIDREEKNKQWQEMVKYYSLEGYHMRTNEKFSDDLHSLFNNGKGKTIVIPWYMIVGKNGEIIKLHAHRPSELKELEEELNVK
jgi:thiol-disulfide isomerase/thioredoxin